MATEIHDLFIKDINRPINGVIKADDNDEQNLKNEIEEYVVTNEIGTKLQQFINAYTNYDEAHGNGVWISGFFGSGKSHLLKMLAVVLQDQKVCGQSSLDLFLKRCSNVTKNDKFFEPNFRKAVTQYHAENILFNIDQKASAINKTSTEALLGVFVKVFNEHCGYFGKQPFVAQFERILDESGDFEDFKKAYLEITGKNWEKDREKLLLIDPSVSKAYAKIKGGSPEDYKGLLKSYKDTYNLSIEDFCKMVHDYIKKKGNNFRLNFFVDEIGQFIADSVQLMLNLQTISEKLTTECGSQAWIIVTAQEDMDTVMGSQSKQQSNDFSKIQDRFKTRIKLTSQDVSEVIQKRLLDKKLDHKAELQSLYEREKNNFKTLFDFVDQSRTYRTYKDDDNFIDCYPFVPYQFDLFQDCIKSLSEKNAFEGKHSSVGERSMLGVFQEVVQQLEKKEVGCIASFDLMYEGIKSMLKTRNSDSVLRAETSLPDQFAVKVLKTLLLVKYVDGFKATVPNITVFMQSAFGEDRNELRFKVNKALDTLVRETYIEKHGAEYSFLTDDEKDIEESINSTTIDGTDLNDKLYELFFKRILKSGKIHDSETNGDHSYTTILDCNKIGKTYDLAINLISPLSINKSPEEWMSERSNEKELVVVLPDDDKLYPELQKFCKTQKYVRLNSSTGGNTAIVQTIINDKMAQNQNRELDLLNMLSDLLQRAKLFTLGDDVTENSGGEPRLRIEKAFLKLVNKAYYKRNLIANMDVKDEEKISSIISVAPIAPMSEAESEIKSYLDFQKRQGLNTTIKQLREKFESIPYGWDYPAIPCLLAFLYARKIVSFKDGSDELAGKNIIDGLKNSRLQQSIQVTLQTQIPAQRIIELKKFIKDYFNVPCEKIDGKDVANVAIDQFKVRADSLKVIQSEINEKQWQMEEELDSAIKRVIQIANCSEVLNLYDKLDKKTTEVLLDDWDDYLEKLLNFMNNSEQKKIYSESFNLVNSPRENYEEIASTKSDLPLFKEVSTTFNELKQKLQSHKFYDAVLGRELTALKSQFDKKLDEAISSYRNSIQKKLNDIHSEIKNETDYKALSEDNREEINNLFKRENDNIIGYSEYSSLLSADAKLTNNDFRLNIYNRISQLNAQQKTENSLVINQTINKDSGTDDITAVQPVKNKTIILIKDIKLNSKAKLSTEEDVDEYINELKKSLLEKIHDGIEILI